MGGYGRLRQAVLHMLVRLTSRRTGESFDIPVVEIFAFRDGKITTMARLHREESVEEFIARRSDLFTG